MATLSLSINGTRHTVDVRPETPLLWVLRDTLGLTGTKFGCGEGLCGSCIVLINDKPVRSCVTTVGSVAEGDILTIEGLSATRSHPVQKAWIAEEVPQCGYCQPGQILAAVALLKEKPHPSDAEIDDAMNGILCRCGTYRRIRKAIHRVAEEGGVR